MRLLLSSAWALALFAGLLGLISINSTTPVESSDPIKDEDSPGRRLLAGPDFTLSARVKLKLVGIITTKEFITQEYYSNNQRRAIVEEHEVSLSDRNEADLRSVYHYHRGQIVRNYLHRKGAECAPISSGQFAKDLLGSLRMATDWLKERPDVPDYIVGIARLLFIIDYNRKSLVESPDSRATRIKIRNHDTILYEISTSNGDNFGMKGKLKIYYAATQEHYAGFDLPMRVEFSDEDWKFFWIDFSFIGALPEHLNEQEDRQIPLDWFATPIGIGCSEKMAPVVKAGWRMVPQEVISFQAQIFKHNKLGTKESAISRRFVAFDSYAGAMRSDAITSSSYSISVIDFWNKKRYSILSSDDADEQRLSKRQCVASKIADVDQYKTFLPFREFVFMGQAVVRGVECYVFEHTSDKLPPAIFPLLSYTNMNGKEETIFGRDQRTFTIVYYFAISSDEKRRKMAVQEVPSGPLMRIDAYNKKLLQYHIDIFDYMNQLVAAPNGDRQEELFAIKDRCSSGQLGSDAYATLGLELSYKPIGAKPKSAQEVVELMESMHLRNKATLRALSRGSIGAITKLSNIETQLKVVGPDQLKIFVEAQLNVPDIEVTEARHVGWTTIEGTSSSVKTIEECFQWSAHIQSGSDPVLFVSCANSCNLDISPSIEYEKDDKTIKSIKSNIGKLDPKRSSPSSCPVMIVETRVRNEQTEAKLAALRTTFNWIRNDYDGRMLRLLMPNEGLFDVPLADLIFEVTKVDINNDKWSVALGYEKAHINDDDSLFKLPARGFAEAISGLGLTESVGQVQQPKQKDSSPDEEPIMNYHTCHSICMSKMSCRSFSVCLTRRGIECIISGVDFRDRTLLKEIEQKLSMERQSKDGSDPLRIKAISVANPKKSQDDSEGADPAADHEQIELKVDFRCKLYKKNVLEMFHKLRATNVPLKNSSLTPVGSQEECAEICLKNNMVFFKRMAQTKLELLQNNEEELEDEELIDRIREEYNNNLMNWCSTFHYLSSSSPDLNEQTKAIIDAEKLKSAGLCVIARSPNTKKGKDSKKKKNGDTSGGSSGKPVDKPPVPRIPFESFQLLYSNLFDVQYGIRLIEAETDDLGKPLPMINKSLREYAPDAESCAQRCFLQASELKPYCKSFDFIEMRLRDPESKFGRTFARRYCEFHTLSLNEIRLNGMVEFMVVDLSSEGARDDPNGTMVHSWHYESRDSYTLEDAVLAELVLEKSEATMLDEFRAYRLHGLGITAIMLAAVILSAALVVLHGDRIANRFKVVRRDSISDPPRSFLSSLVPGQPTSTIRHKRFVASDQDLPDIPELNSI